MSIIPYSNSTTQISQQSHKKRNHSSESNEGNVHMMGDGRDGTRWVVDSERDGRRGGKSRPLSFANFAFPDCGIG